MKTEKKKTYRRVTERVVIAYFNDKMAACVNAGIAPCSGSSSEGQPTGSLLDRRLVAETNPDGTRCAKEISFGIDRFEFSNCVTDLNRANLRAGERDHFSEVARGNQFHRCCTED